MKHVLQNTFLLLAAALLAMPGHAWAGSLVDPTRPPPAYMALAKAGVEELGGRTWKLSMLRLSGKYPVAIINGHLLRPGDRMGAAEVVSISNRGVELNNGKETVLVTMAGTAVKRRADTTLMKKTSP